ncbi:Haloacid dehalogenase-like hydrolase (HAD) superfamily protein [Rhynchospora pubera]|uniref:Haloacid dehalogenase-like hydrolase (HAD) superfamily protein n=1 Tax=Rhynchospora pubera TaxID=906938 RepID=A0AAV8EV06_9POAL|nr:Haloacid dehalogenase-like hydrolase (HAD) superfamily protein [Rhynchospora pubera]
MRALSLSHFSSSPSILRSKLKFPRFHCASSVNPSTFLSISNTRGRGHSRFHPSLLSISTKTMSTQCSISREIDSSESAKASPSFQCLDGIRTLAESGQFKAWFLDQYGVLHDGKKPYPGAIATLEKLAATGAKMVIISNSSRRAVVTYDKLRALGFDPSLFLGAITSGELTHQYLLRRDDPWFAALGRRCIHMTWNDRGAISLEGLGLEVVSRVDDADFILAHGTEAIGSPSGGSQPMDLEGLQQILELCAKRSKSIPMVVANPDYVTVEARDLRVMPGTLGAKYEKLGGDVRWMGKPDKVIYESAMRLTGINPKECITVGDSLHHDIKGANKAGIQSAFITGGIHADELGLGSFGETATLDAVHSLCTKFDANPNFVLPSFTW